MSRPALELADIVRQYGPVYRERHALPLYQLKLLDAIERCRTAALGGHVEQCDQCEHLRISYNSCRNRHCPKCQGQARAKWLQQREGELLPVEYFHVVFTLPEQIAAIAYHNKEVVYDLLFRMAAETLLTIGRDQRHLGAELGFFAVLHTWGQNLHLHPHVHCVVPGGGISADADRWVPCRPGFFLPVRVLSRLFRRLFLQALLQAFDRGQLQFHSELASLADRNAFVRYLKPLHQAEWVVYAKPPFGGPHQVLAYLARYTHRVAISNQRLLALQDGQVSFQWNDYGDHNRSKVMRLDAEEFLRRFLLHAVPPGFQRIRNYGFLANAARKHKLCLCRRLLTADRTGLLPKIAPTEAAPLLDLSDSSAVRCPLCGHGRMICIEILPPSHSQPLAPLDSS